MCLLIIASISTLYLLDILTTKLFAVANAVTAIIAAFFGIFARKPIAKEDMSLAVEKVIANYDNETFLKLKQAKEEEERIRDYIENRSNEIFLLKLRGYLLEEIESKYINSDLAKLIGDLEKIEADLDAMNVTYKDIELPERFKKILGELNQQQKLDLYLDLLDALPFFPGRLLRNIYKILGF